MNALMTKPAIGSISSDEAGGDPRADATAQVDALVDVLLSVLVFRIPAGGGVSFLHRVGRSAPGGAPAEAEGLPTCHLFETACFLFAALDSWHAERGLEHLRDVIFRAVIVPRFFTLFDLPGRIADLEKVVVSRMEVYRALSAASPAEVSRFFMQSLLSSALRGGPRIESWIPDYPLIAENLVLAMAALSDLTAFANSRLPLCFGALESFYRRIYSSTSR